MILLSRDPSFLPVDSKDCNRRRQRMKCLEKFSEGGNKKKNGDDSLLAQGHLMARSTVDYPGARSSNSTWSLLPPSLPPSRSHPSPPIHSTITPTTHLVLIFMIRIRSGTQDFASLGRSFAQPDFMMSLVERRMNKLRG